MTKQRLVTAVALAVLLLAGAGQSSAQQAAEQTAAIDPAAMQALDRMGSYLRGLKTYSLTADDTIDQVLESGQRIQLSSTIDLQVRKPNGLRADIDTDRKSLQLFFDGKNFTLFGRKKKVYAIVPAPPTIKEMLTFIEAKYGVAIPLVDVFLWGQDTEAAADIKEAIVIGPSNLGGRMTDHYAFRQEDVDWQIWITQGETPLPLKYVITTMDEPGQPQYMVNLSWNTTAKPSDAAFIFEPTEDHYLIDIVALDESPAAE